MENQKRLTIAFFLDFFTDEYEIEIWNGVMDKAEKMGVNLLCITAQEVSHPDEPRRHANVLYDLIDPDHVDGLIFLTAALANDIGPEEMKKFLDQYKGIPILSVGQKIEGITSILVDNKSCMLDAITHLIEVHDYKRIAYIGGPANNPEANDRLNGYKTVLTNFNIPVDENLIFPGEFDEDSGKDAVRALLKEKREFDAIACVDDVTATGAIKELGRNNIIVPAHKAVIGFDDIEEAKFLTPPLTTVRQPLFEQGEKAVEIIVKIIHGDKIPEDIVLPTEVKIRQSCGCLDPTVKKAAVGSFTLIKQKDGDDSVKIDNIRSEIINTIIDSSIDLTTKRANRLLKAFITEINSSEERNFLSTLDVILGEVIKEEGDIFSWQDAISVIRKHILSIINNKQTIVKVEDLLSQASVMIGEAAERSQAYERFVAKQQTRELNELGNTLITTFELDDLISLMKEELPSVDIPSCYISLFEGDGEIPEKSKLIVAFDREGPVELNEENVSFASKQLLPFHIMKNEERYTYIVVPLYFSRSNLGYALTQVGPKDGELYDTLRAQLSTALEGAILLEKLKEKQRQEMARLKKEMEIAKRIQTALLPTTLSVDQFDLSAAMYPADDVGGDYYDFFKGTDGRYWYVIGDVSGHGLTAGLIMLMAQSSILSAVIGNPGIEMKDLYSIVNLLLFENIRHRLLTDHFMTLSIIAQDKDNNFTIIGSHIEQIIYRKETNTCEEVASGGLWAGLSPEAVNTVTKRDFKLKQDDILILFTDGLIEAMDAKGEQFDVKRVEDILIEHHEKSVDEIKKILIQNVFDFMEHQADDITLFLIKKQ